MARCKDCVHYEVCQMHYKQKCELTYETEREVEIAMRKAQKAVDIECDYYKDRSRFVELPCMVGDILYHPVQLRNMIAEYKIKSFQIYPHCVWVNWNIVDGVATINMPGIYANEIGETVFLTREEAEQALKEREANGQSQN